MSINKELRQIPSLSGPFTHFNVNDVPDNPYELFLTWLRQAIDSQIKEPHAMVLSTVDPDGFPDARTLILKRIDSDGWYFASSATGRKGQQLLARPQAALTFYWPILGKQVRIRGIVNNMGKDASAEDFLARSDIARAGALMDRQSDVLHHPNELARSLEIHMEQLNQNPYMIADAWTLYCVAPTEVEFWQADENRQHQRLRYVVDGERWRRELLWP